MFNTDIKYLSFLINHNKELLKSPLWEWFHDFLREEIYQQEKQLYRIKEQELCQKLNSTQTTNTISTFLSISQS